MKAQDFNKSVSETLQKAVLSAQKRAIQMTKTALSKDYRAAYNIKKEDLDPLIRVSLEVGKEGLNIKGKGIPVYKLNPKAEKTGVSIKLYKTGSRLFINHAFMKTIKAYNFQEKGTDSSGRTFTGVFLNLRYTPIKKMVNAAGNEKFAELNLASPAFVLKTDNNLRQKTGINFSDAFKKRLQAEFNYRFNK